MTHSNDDKCWCTKFRKEKEDYNDQLRKDMVSILNSINNLHDVLGNVFKRIEKLELHRD